MHIHPRFLIYSIQIFALTTPMEIIVNKSYFLLSLSLILIIFCLPYRCRICGSSPSDERNIGLKFPFWGNDFSRCGVCGSDNSWEWSPKNIFIVNNVKDKFSDNVQDLQVGTKIKNLEGIYQYTIFLSIYLLLMIIMKYYTRLSP